MNKPNPKTCLTILWILLMSSVQALAQQQGREKYEFMRNLPVYADSLIADLTYPLAWGNSDIRDFDAWKRAAREKVFDCMFTPPPAPANGFEAKVLYEEQRDGYKARKLEIRLSRYYTVPAYLLIPDGKGPFPAVNVLHDHGAHLFIGKEKVIRPLACEDSVVINDAEAWVSNYEGQYFGDYLARHGFVVFATDAPMWGERGQKEGPRRDKYDMIAGNMMMYGIDLSAYMTYDDIRATDFLASLPEVDPQRIGCTGWSMGAYRTWMLSALSDRIKAGAAVCWMVTTDEQLTFHYKRTASPVLSRCSSSTAPKTNSSPWLVSRRPSPLCTMFGRVRVLATRSRPNSGICPTAVPTVPKNVFSPSSSAFCNKKRGLLNLSFP